MTGRLSGRRIAGLVAHGFEQVELVEPRAALVAEGATVDVVSPEADVVKGWNRMEWGDPVHVDRGLDRIHAADYDALLVPGGVMSPDRLRTVPDAVRLTREFADQGKPIAAICHGPSLLIEAGVVRGVTITSYPSLKTDLTNAGAVWVDRDVVIDRGTVSSRRPADVPAFIRALIAALGDCGEEAAAPTVPNPSHRAANCGWSAPTLLLDAPFCWDAERYPWACVRGTIPHVLETTEVCRTCVHWAARPPQAPLREVAFMASGA
jgi:protease I